MLRTTGHCYLGLNLPAMDGHLPALGRLWTRSGLRLRTPCLYAHRFVAAHARLFCRTCAAHRTLHLPLLAPRSVWTFLCPPALCAGRAPTLPDASSLVKVAHARRVLRHARPDADAPPLCLVLRACAPFTRRGATLFALDTPRYAYLHSVRLRVYAGTPRFHGYCTHLRDVLELDRSSAHGTDVCLILPPLHTSASFRAITFTHAFSTRVAVRSAANLCILYTRDAACGCLLDGTQLPPLDFLGHTFPHTSWPQLLHATYPSPRSRSILPVAYAGRCLLVFSALVPLPADVAAVHTRLPLDTGVSTHTYRTGHRVVVRDAFTDASRRLPRGAGAGSRSGSSFQGFTLRTPDWDLFLARLGVSHLLPPLPRCAFPLPVCRCLFFHRTFHAPLAVFGCTLPHVPRYTRAPRSPLLRFLTVHCSHRPELQKDGAFSYVSPRDVCGHTLRTAAHARADPDDLGTLLRWLFPCRDYTSSRTRVFRRLPPGSHTRGCRDDRRIRLHATPDAPDAPIFTQTTPLSFTVAAHALHTPAFLVPKVTGFILRVTPASPHGCGHARGRLPRTCADAALPLPSIAHS